MARIKLILLDFDGTLVDTRRANALAYVQTLSEAGIDITEQEYADKYFGVRCPEFMHSLGITDPDQAERLRHRKIELYPQYFSTVKLNKPLWDLCQSMRATGIKVWIVSTGHIDNISNVMRYLRLEDGIDGILSSDDVDDPKPAPDCFLRAMQIVGATPDETLIFEDSAVGLEAARRSGAPFFKVEL
ncbi:MAG: HAD family phosphatase [Alistipes sp.]|nr:HAD family phosphatase [Alistipes sp.]